MRIIVLSDSHGDFARADSVVSRNIGYCDMVIHLGDGEDDVRKLREKYQQLIIHSVRGNCDYDNSVPASLVVSAGGVRIFCTHGHRCRVHYGTELLSENAIANDCLIALFGHTHSRCEETYGGIYLMNPGSCARPRDGRQPSFGVVEILKDGSIITGVYDV